ncbi:MAG: mechanosensitive ion channel family protein [archaeon]|nr:mechanosensitive ion channel family protein [archaeon]
MVLEEFVGGTYFGSTIVQYAMFAGIALGTTILAKILYFFIKKYGTILTSKTENKFDDLIIEAINKPMTFIGFIIGLSIGYQFLTPDAFIADNFFKAVEALLILDLMWLALKLIDGFIVHIVIPLSAKTESKLDDQLIPILNKISKSAVVLMGGLIILSNFGIDVLPLIAGLGIGGLAIAFAAQKTVEDMFGGISIFTSKHFVVGDVVKVGSVEGTVEAVGIRNTKIIDWDGRANIMPNSKVVSDNVLNISSEPARRVSITLGLTYSTSYAKMQEAMKILKDIVNKHKECEKDPRAVFKEYGDSSLDIWFVYFIKNKDRKFEIMSEINLEIKKQFEKANLSFAFPSQSVYLESMPKGRK